MRPFFSGSKKSVTIEPIKESSSEEQASRELNNRTISYLLISNGKITVGMISFVEK